MGQAARAIPLVGKYAFRVQDPTQGNTQAKFQKATGFDITINIGTYREGGAQVPMKEATTADFSNGTLEHGVMEDMQLYQWCLECVNVMANVPDGGQGVASPSQLRNLRIEQLRRDRTVLKTMRVYNAQPAKFSCGEWDNTSSDVQVETLEIAYEYFHLKLGV